MILKEYMELQEMTQLFISQALELMQLKFLQTEVFTVRQLQIIL